MTNALWHFIDQHGSFRFPHPERVSALYFPLANEAACMSAITPDGKGDCKSDWNHFLMQPVTRDDLQNLTSGRMFWFYAPDRVWLATGTAGGNSTDNAVLEAGLLWHRVTRANDAMGLRAVITNIVPAGNDPVELMQITVTNTAAVPLTVTPTAAIPIFGRSADNLRDHRHVTSLLHRITVLNHGVIVTPTMSFDERGHKVNGTGYAVMGCEADGALPVGVFPTVEAFLGEGGTFLRPGAVFDNLPPHTRNSPDHQGKEAAGALRFTPRQLLPGESATYILIMAIIDRGASARRLFETYNSAEKFQTALNHTALFWQQRSAVVLTKTGAGLFDNWLRWVTIQPVLRTIFGCSFLPDFDYGRGGKGWRDLWQDCLALLFSNPPAMRPILVANFGGVRIDGTNATIITKKPGFFIADRNKISRVWMDHGVWPFFTLNLYLQQTGDFSILFEQRSYFYDRQLCRARETDRDWNPHYKHCKHLHTRDGHIYKGTILEHVLVQVLTAFFHVGDHNIIKLEDADWNDGLDMAAERGESVAFSCFYAWTLQAIAEALSAVRRHKRKNIALAQELMLLLDRVRRRPIDYGNPAKKRALLERYFHATKRRVSGRKVTVPIDKLIADLLEKKSALSAHIAAREWIDLSPREGMFNGYYDNLGHRVEGKKGRNVRMTLTGQVFPIFSGVAEEQQVRKIYRSVCHYLRDSKHGGYRLNTNFGKPQFNLGRAFSFSYGDKENGAVFSHMCVMFANALYRRGFVPEGFTVLNSLFELATNTTTSCIYPCLPEYFNAAGRGLYSYLTGSASWYVMTMLTEAFGVKGQFGDLLIEPKLTAEQFRDTTTIQVSSSFAGHRITVVYHNPRKLGYGSYRIQAEVSPADLPFTPTQTALLIQRADLVALRPDADIIITVTLV